MLLPAQRFSWCSLHISQISRVTIYSLDVLLFLLGTPQSCPTPWDPMDYNLPGSSVHGILQTRILEWVAIPFSKGSCYNPETWDWTQVSCVVGRLFTIWATREAQISIENGHISYLCLKYEPVFYILWTFFSRGRIISNWIWPQEICLVQQDFVFRELA